MRFFRKWMGDPVAGLTEYERWLLNEWYERKVAKYDRAESESRDLYDGFMGSTLTRFMKNEARDDVNISQRDMELFLTEKDHRSHRINGRLHFYGVRVIIHGDVRSGNYGT